MKKIFIPLIILSASLFAGAQSKSFNLGRWMQTQSALLQELNRSYVDSLPIERMQKASIDAMLSILDPYTIWVSEEEGEDFELMISKTYGGIGAIIYKQDKDGPVFINEPYADSPAAKAGLRCGDAIYAIDGKTTIGLNATEASDRMRGKPGTQVTFKVKRVYTGKEEDITITRERIHIPDIEYVGILEDGKTGYILLSGFTEGVANDVRSAIKELREKGMERLVLDLRGNGGGILQEAVKIVGLFVPKGSLVVTSKGNEYSRDEIYRTVSDPVEPKLPLIVLVDSGSASASEIVAGSLQDYDRATIMGNRTFGKGLVQSVRPMPYGGHLKITTAKYYIPSGRCVQAIDYTNRNEDGSVGNIPDSLTHEFTTAHGRKVRDGGGITPDVELKRREYSRLTYSLVLSGIIEQYCLDYVRSHESIPPAKDYHFDDYEGFIEFAKAKKFDARTSARASYDRMVEELKKDGLEESMKEELEALKVKLDLDKESFLRLKKDEIVPFIEQSIVARYYFQKAAVEIAIRYDEALRQALVSPLAVSL
jgi:carboxyl-terminal processing protease